MDPAAILSNLKDRHTSGAIGFDAGRQKSAAADFGQFVQKKNGTLETVNIFRIDGM